MMMTGSMNCATGSIPGAATRRARVLQIPEGEQAYVDEVKKFAEESGRASQLREKLNVLAQFGCPRDGKDPEQCICTLSRDFAPHSFSWVVERRQKDGTYKYWINGGLILHGAHVNGGDGGLPTLSVNLTPADGWEIHS